MKQYLADIERMIEEGKLSEEKEFYTPLRFRGGKKVADLATTGVRYIELRNIDLNPYARLHQSRASSVLTIIPDVHVMDRRKEDCDHG